MAEIFHIRQPVKVQIKKGVIVKGFSRGSTRRRRIRSRTGKGKGINQKEVGKRVEDMTKGMVEEEGVEQGLLFMPFF